MKLRLRTSPLYHPIVDFRPGRRNHSLAKNGAACGKKRWTGQRKSSADFVNGKETSGPISLLV